MQPDIHSETRHKREKSEKQVEAVIMNTTISRLIGEVYQKLSKVKSLYNERIFTQGVFMCSKALTNYACFFLFCFAFFEKEMLCLLGPFVNSLLLHQGELYVRMVHQ